MTTSPDSRLMHACADVSVHGTSSSACTLERDRRVAEAKGLGRRHAGCARPV